MKLMHFLPLQRRKQTSIHGLLCANWYSARDMRRRETAASRDEVLFDGKTDVTTACVRTWTAAYIFSCLWTENILWFGRCTLGKNGWVNEWICPKRNLSIWLYMWMVRKVGLFFNNSCTMACHHPSVFNCSSDFFFFYWKDAKANCISP